MNIKMTEGDKLMRDEIKELFNDPMIKKLGQSFQTLNIFKVLKLGRHEIRHSNFLSWLMDPNANHGLGAEFLEIFLKDAIHVDFNLSGKVVNVQTEYSSNKGRIDLLITFDEKVICIENKIDSGENSDQLSRYIQHVNSFYPSFDKYFIFLTPDGRSPETPEDRKFFKPYSYEKIIDHIIGLYERRKNKMDVRVAIYLQDYIELLQNEILNGEDLASTLDHILINHKDIFKKIEKKPELLIQEETHENKDVKRTIDLIIDIKNSRLNKIFSVLREKILDEGWVMGTSRKGLVRFLTSDLDQIIPRTGFEHIKHRESFLFEFNILENRISFFTLIPKGNDHNKQVLVEALDRVVGKGNSTGKTITKHVKMHFDVDVTSLEIDEEYIIERIDAFWPQIVETVNAVEKKILKEKDRFIGPVNNDDGKALKDTIK